MPLTKSEREFLHVVDRMKIYVLLLALAVLLYLLLIPTTEASLTTFVLGLALCGVFWLTHRLLSIITTLDLELTRVTNSLKHCLPEREVE